VARRWNERPKGGIGLSDDFDALDLAAPDAPELWNSEPSVAVLAPEPVLRRRIAAVLDYDRLTVAAEGADAARVLATAVARRARALVVAVPGVDAAVDALYDARDAGFEGHVVAVAPRGGARAVRAALREGVDAVVWDEQTEAALALAVRGAGVGLSVIPCDAGERLEPPPLSHREREVLALAADGASNQQIARRLMISLSTVKSHLSSSFAKLGVGGRSEALAAIADEHGAVLPGHGAGRP
jgi:DNA-binding NarL/FixJ family response regulator